MKLVRNGLQALDIVLPFQELIVFAVIMLC